MNQIRPMSEIESPVKKIISDRDARLVAAYDAQGDKPDIPALSREFQLSGQYIRIILTKHGIKPVSNAKRGRKPVSKTAVNNRASPIRAQVSQVLRNIYAEYELENGFPPSATLVAEEIGLNRTAFMEITTGSRDIKLSELILIAKAANVTLAELITPKWITKSAKS